MWGNSNEDCRACAYSITFDDGGGDYEDIVWHCDKRNKDVTYISKTIENKPCKLPKGKYYIATYKVI